MSEGIRDEETNADNLPKDIFSIPDPESYSCSIFSYERPHMVMHLIVKNEQNPDSNVFYVRFDPVDYFEGPTSWKGARFETASWDKHDDFPRVFLQNLTFSSNKLFVVNTDRGPVRIIAGLGVITRIPLTLGHGSRSNK